MIQLNYREGDYCISLVAEDDISQAAEVHAAAWRASHRPFCTEEFVTLHTPERQEGFLRRQMEEGASIYLLRVSGAPVGIVSIKANVIGDLYILPEEQRKGYGTKLLRFAIGQCNDTASLWVLSNNEGAQRLYKRNGFYMTGNTHPLSETLCELEMKQ